jgi:hypothetical protein
VGRGALSSVDMTVGSACEASRWRSDSGVECKAGGGGQGRGALAAGGGALA